MGRSLDLYDSHDDHQQPLNSNLYWTIRVYICLVFSHEKSTEDNQFRAIKSYKCLDIFSLRVEEATKPTIYSLC